jgi:hypothetical protein
MKTLLIAASVFVLNSPALAQTTGAAGSMATPPSETAMPASTAAAQDAAPAQPTDPKAIIASEFPSYDKDGNGALAPAEFDAWMVALKEKSGDTAMKPSDKTAWLKTAFATADKDKSKGVSLTELTAYLTAAG